MNSTVGPIFNEKVTEKVKFVGPMNSASMHYSRLTWSNSAVGTKKKKEEKTQYKTQMWDSAQSKCSL